MNAWVMPKGRTPHRVDDVTPEKHRELLDLGLSVYHIERHQGSERFEAYVYTNMVEVPAEMWTEANRRLFGDGGSFTVTDSRGRAVVP